MDMIKILKERLPSNIAYQIMSYVGPHPVAATMQEYNRFMELNIFPKRLCWGEWNTLYGYPKRENWTEKLYLTCLTYRDAGGWGRLYKICLLHMALVPRPRQ